MMKEIEKVVHEGKAAQPRKVRIQLERSKLGIPHLRGSFPWVRLGSRYFTREGCTWAGDKAQHPVPHLVTKMSSSPPAGVEPGSITIGLVLLPSHLFNCCKMKLEDDERDREGGTRRQGSAASDSPLTWIISLGPVRQQILHQGGLYLGWGQGPTPSTAFGDKDEQFASGWRRTRKHNNWPPKL
ncbi:hypothetical protein DY000_02056492 [Brassica cretica]|uniref:Uncharacterized protein n=1 Tax=Brassica cretica TaxID=69181 RepID=A0ABQ7A7X8_BRACR|nr:hypothetical protein DY000_02056492 [Brassica cretica]